MIIMTKDITIKTPTPKVIKMFDALREKKQKQIKKLVESKQCTFTVVV